MSLSIARICEYMNDDAMPPIGQQQAETVLRILLEEDPK